MKLGLYLRSRQFKTHLKYNSYFCFLFCLKVRFMILFSFNKIFKNEFFQSKMSEQKHIVLYYGDDLEPYRNHPSVYLDGPKGNIGSNEFSWRHKLIDAFVKQGFKHVIIVPEKRGKSGRPPYGKDEFYAWENQAMQMATINMFWMPRDSTIFPGRDINDRWGYWKTQKNVIIGYPTRSEEMDYQGWYAKENNITVVHHLENMVQYVSEQLNQFSNMEFVIENGQVILPPNEDILYNVWLKKMIERMGIDFVNQVDTIIIPGTNLPAYDSLCAAIRNDSIYDFHSTCNGSLILQRTQAWTGKEDFFYTEAPRLTPEFVKDETPVKIKEINDKLILARDDADNSELITKEEYGFLLGLKLDDLMSTHRNRVLNSIRRMQRLGIKYDEDPKVQIVAEETEIKTMSVEDKQKMQRLHEMRMRLGLTDEYLSEERRHDEEDKNVMDGDNYEEPVPVRKIMDKMKSRPGRRRR